VVVAGLDGIELEVAVPVGGGGTGLAGGIGDEFETSAGQDRSGGVLNGAGDVAGDLLCVGDGREERGPNGESYQTGNRLRHGEITL
jgi:hypothetical protein